MRFSFVLAAALVLGCSSMGKAQASQAPSPNAAFYPTDPMSGILVELTKISGSVTALTRQMQVFVDKFEKVGGTSFNEKQQKLILGMELLSRAEARVAVLQHAQIELTEKLNETRAKLTQNDIDLRMGGVEKGVTYEGTTRTDEIRDARRARLQADRVNLSQLSQQLQSNLAETTDGLKDAQSLVARLRKLYLPQIEREIYDAQ